MYCRFCGAENPDEAVFCKKCGKKLTAAELENAQSVSASSPTPQAVPPVQQNFAISCPYCHAGGESCHPIVKTLWRRIRVLERMLWADFVGACRIVVRCLWKLC